MSEEAFWNTLLPLHDKRPAQSTSLYDNPILQEHLDYSYPHNKVNDFEDYISDHYVPTHSDKLPILVPPDSPRLSPTIFSLPKPVFTAERIHNENTIRDEYTINGLSSIYAPPTPGTSLTSAIADLNVLSPSVFRENQNPFALAFDISRTPTPQIQNSPSSSRPNVLRRISNRSARGRNLPTHERLTEESEDAKQASERERSLRTGNTRGRKALYDETRQHACELCGKRYARREHFLRHVRSIHSDEKPFPCNVCGKDFSRRDNMCQHLKTHDVQSK